MTNEPAAEAHLLAQPPTRRQQLVSLGLIHLEPGAYTAVCFVDIPDGILHDMRGIIAEFTVE